MTAWLRCAALGALGALGAAACTDARQIVLSIDSTAGVPCDIDRIRIHAASTTYERALDGRLPIAITLADETRDGSFALDVIGMRGDEEVMRASGMLQFADREVTVPVRLEPDCTAAAPCALSDPAAPPITARFTCGPEVRGYAIEPAVESLQDACNNPSGGRVLTDGSRGPVRLDALAGALPGFGFQFYGRPIHQIWIHSHGYISFDRDDPDPNDDLIPGAIDRNLVGGGAAPPARSVLAFWDTVTVRSGEGVCYALTGAPGHQVFRATWRHACATNPCTGSSDDLNFEIALNEASQTIVLTYDTMKAGTPDRAQGALATVGIVDEATGCPAAECSASTGRCPDGTPCGFSQVFSQMVQDKGLQKIQFTPRPD